MRLTLQALAKIAVGRKLRGPQSTRAVKERLNGCSPYNLNGYDRAQKYLDPGWEQLKSASGWRDTAHVRDMWRKELAQVAHDYLNEDEDLRIGFNEGATHSLRPPELDWCKR